MSTIDIRTNSTPDIDGIVFADNEASDGTYQAYVVLPRPYDNEVKIQDGSDDYLVLAGAHHARNLIKALEKAIELGWLK